MPRWTVTTRDGVEDVGADTCEALPGGTLLFRQSVRRGALIRDEVTVAYAPTYWTTVTRDEA